MPGTNEPLESGTPGAELSDTTPAGSGAGGGSPTAGGGAPEGGAPSGGAVGSDPQAAPPTVSQEAFDNAIAAQSEEMQKFTNQMYNYLDQFSKSVDQRLHGFSRQVPQHNQQLPKPGQFPDFESFRNALAQADDHALYQAFQNRNQHVDQTIDSLKSEIKALKQEQQIRENTNRWYEFMSGQINDSVKAHKELQDDAVRQLFENQVIAHAQSVNGDFRRMNVPALAKKLVAQLNAFADARYGKTVPPGGIAPPGGRVPPSVPPGSPSIPGKKPIEVTDMESFELAQEQMLPHLADIARAELGEE